METDGNPLTLGQANSATAKTSLASTVAGGDPAVTVTLTGAGSAVEAITLGDGFGVRGIGGTGGLGAGVFGSGTTGVGVWGASVSESGVYAESSSAPGVFAVSGTSGGAYGISNSGLGLYGQSVTDVAVRGISVNYIGVDGIGGTIGVAAAGPQANLFLPADAGTRAAPTADAIAHERGEVLTQADGTQWVCVASGTPGTWRKTAGPTTAGQLHVLAAPARIYDSRPNTAPSQGPKTKFAAGNTRTFDLKVNSSGVPAGATAAIVTLLLVNAASAAGNLTIWANGVARPSANSVVWGGTAGRFTATALTALDSQARVQVNSSQVTDLVIDVVGYYRGPSSSRLCRCPADSSLLPDETESPVPYPNDEVAAAAERYRAVREAIGRGEATWTALADLFTDDAVYIDPAWGRIEGRDEIRAFMEESMAGLEDWTFPVEFIAIDGDNVVVKWTQILPGTRPDGGQWTQSGYSTLVYAGDGRFSYEEDLLNMAHVIEDIVASGWAPGPGFTPPPAAPNRDVSRPLA